MKILITGGEGFIGHRISLELVRRGHEVLVIDQTQEDGDIGSGKTFDANAIHRFININQVDVVCHMAAMVGGGRFLAEREFEICTHNMDVDSQVITGFARSSARRLVYCSSSMVFQNGESPCYEWHQDSENPTIPAPTNNYGFSKLQGERLAIMAGRQFNKEVVIGRPFNVYGPGELSHHERNFGVSHVIPDFYVKLCRLRDNGEPFTLFGDGKQTRSFTHADETARAFALMCIKEEAANKTFNVASEENISIEELAHMMARIMGIRNLEIGYLDAWHGDTKQRQPVVDRMRYELGWTSLIPFELGLRRNIEWLEKHQEEL